VSEYNCACGRHATHKMFPYRPVAGIFGRWRYTVERLCCACYVRLGYPPAVWHRACVAMVERTRG
jgi:hypothetical protein